MFKKARLSAAKKAFMAFFINTLNLINNVLLAKKEFTLYTRLIFQGLFQKLKFQDPYTDCA